MVNKLSMSEGRKMRGFTLIELLVVIAIIGVLAAMLLPVLAKAKKKAYRVKCTNNMKQIANTLQSFSLDRDDSYPWMLSENESAAEFDVLNKELGLVSKNIANLTGQVVDNNYFRPRCCYSIHDFWLLPELRSGLKNPRMLRSPLDTSVSSVPNSSGNIKNKFDGFGNAIDLDSGTPNNSGSLKYGIWHKTQSYAIHMGGDALKPETIIGMTRNVNGNRWDTLSGNIWTGGIKNRVGVKSHVENTYMMLWNRKEHILNNRYLGSREIGKTDKNGNPIISFIGPSAKGMFQHQNTLWWYDVRKGCTISMLDDRQGNLMLSDGSVKQAQDGDLEQAVRGHANAQFTAGVHNELVETIARPEFVDWGNPVKK